jgi:hypothetical protein
MKEFNENPFKKDTPVLPFSNGTEAEGWMHQNCDKCYKYETESKSERTAKCKLSYHLSLGFIKGNIPLWVAKEIGCEYDPLYHVTLMNNCRERRGEHEKDLPF